MTRTQGRISVATMKPRVRGLEPPRSAPRRPDFPDRTDRSHSPDLSPVFDASPVGMALIRSDGAIDRTNAAMRRLLRGGPGSAGIEAPGDALDDAPRGLPLLDLVRAPAEAVRDGVNEVLRGERRAFSFECEHLTPEGAPVPLRVTLSALSAPAVRRRARSAVLATVEELAVPGEARRRLRDLEERLCELEEQLRHTARLSLTGELSASLAHEMGQPLAAVANYTQAALHRLSAEASAPTEVLEHLCRADAEARRGGRIVRNLASFVRSRRCQRADADLREVLAEIAEMMNAAGAGQGVRVEVSVCGAALPVSVDRVQVQQVALNLVKNAAESAAAAGCTNEPIEVRLWTPDGATAEVAVRDSGCGISSEAAQRLFSPFFTTKPQGMGLGLAICRSIMEAHGGGLWGENNPPPSPGATFRFRLPLSINNGEQSYDG